MENQKIHLTSSEIAPLWFGYLNDSMVNCVLRYFLNKVEDQEIRPVVEYALSLTSEQLQYMNGLFTKEQFPTPRAFTEEDVNIQAPRLFSDGFMLFYIRRMGITGVESYASALAGAARTDIREFFTNNLKTAAELLNRADEVLLSKGLFIRSPVIPMTDSIEFVQKEGWLNGFMGDRRPINVCEITHLYLNRMANAIGKALMIGFSQVAKDREVVQLIVRGRDIADKHIQVFGNYLQNDNLPAPMTWEIEVTNTTEAPFSDKLMLFHTVALTTIGMGSYGVAISQSMRRDLVADYIRLTAEIGTFCDDGAELMIKHKWLEKIPGAIERDALITS
jgi:hypothetical protein